MKKILVAFGVLLLMGCQGQKSVSTNSSQTPEMKHDFTELTFEILEEGTGQEVKDNDYLLMHYSGYLEDGTKFDSSIDRGEPFRFSLGTGQVIKGWDEGIVGMKVGEKRKLYIPYSYGYGVMGYPPVIPAKANLIFDIELVDIVVPVWKPRGE